MAIFPLITTTLLYGWHGDIFFTRLYGWDLREQKWHWEKMWRGRAWNSEVHGHLESGLIQQKKGNWSNPTVVLHPQIRDLSKQKLGSSTNKHGQLDRGKWGVRANFCKESCGDWTSKAWDLMAVDILIYGYTYITRARWDWSRTRESNNQIPEIRDTSWIYSQNQHKQSNLLKTGFAWFWRHYSLRCNPWKPTHTLRLNILWS